MILMPKKAEPEVSWRKAHAAMHSSVKEVLVGCCPRECRRMHGLHSVYAAPLLLPWMQSRCCKQAERHTGKTFFSSAATLIT
jgi:hypothetical protein